MDIVCLSEKYLGSSVSTNDDNSLHIPGYSSISADHPSNAKPGGVLVYYKSYQLLKSIGVKYLHNCINFE